MSDSHDPNVGQARVHFFSQAVHLSVRRVHVLSSGARTYGRRGEKVGGGALKAWIDEGKKKKKIPLGNFIHTRGECESVRTIRSVVALC